MSSLSLTLPISACYLPDGSADNVAAQIQMRTSSAGTPKPRWIEALFDDTTDEHVFWSFVIPSQYQSTPVLKVYYKALSATSGTAAFGGLIAAVSDGDAIDVDANEFDAVNAGSATVPGTAGYMDVISITLSNDDSMVAGDHVIFGLLRDVSEDSVTGDLEVVNVEFTFSNA